MSLIYRRRPKVGPFYLNVTKRGIPSVSVEMGKRGELGHTTYNLTHGRATVESGVTGLRYQTKDHAPNRAARRHEKMTPEQAARLERRQGTVGYRVALGLLRAVMVLGAVAFCIWWVALIWG